MRINSPRDITFLRALAAIIIGLFVVGGIQFVGPLDSSTEAANPDTGQIIPATTKSGRQLYITRYQEIRNSVSEVLFFAVPLGIMFLIPSRGSKKPSL